MRWRMTTWVLALLLLWIALTSLACEGGNVYVGVGVSSPYYGYPYGRYPGGYGGTIVVGRRF